MTEERCLSIITNFGCHYSCSYCIVKKTGVCVPKTTIQGLEKLEEMITKYRCTQVSVSGGGDPLHEYKKHKKYYRHLLRILDKLGIPLEVHTSYTTTDFPCEKTIRVVYHLREIKKLRDICRKGEEKVRVVFVVTDDFTKEKLDFIANFCKNSDAIDELSFRQLIRPDYTESHHLDDYLKQGHEEGKWWYIEQKDYNIYYAENEVKFHYKDFTKRENR